ncbi:transcriptional regulator [Amycolatopsis sp. cg5]|uniref:transcriptional regulator n=1 Tax=Amycolatopsis sp. cg5 TaxID=3238802 RepID=UPI0035241B34
MSLLTLDPVFADPVRLHLASLLEVEQWCWLGYLRHATGMSQARLARHLRLLGGANYVVATKGADSKTWVRLTAWGEQRLDQHLGALDAAVKAAQQFTTQMRVDEPDWFEVVSR